MGADPADQPRSGLEEREFVAGKQDDSVGSDDFARYVLLHRHGGGGGVLPEIKRRRLEFVVDGGALPSPTPSSDRDSDGTISDVDVDAGAGADPLAQGLPFPCPVCRREFASQKAVCGHMRAHDPRERRQGEKERPAVVAAVIGVGWAVTRKRGSVGGRSASPESEGVVDSMATVVSEPVVDAMPIAFACRSSSNSAEPNPPPSDGSTGILDASSDSPTSQAVVRPPCSRQFLEDHQPSAPQPAVAQAQHFAEAAAPQFVVHQRAAPQVVGHHVQPSSPPQPPARDAQGWWLCKEKGCDHRFATHQGLGGHMAAHKIRQNNEAAAAVLHLGVGDPRPAKLFPCKMCPSVFTSGVQLGGHMRKHYPGKVTPKKKRVPRPKVSARELASALSLSLPLPPAAMEVAQAQPAASPGVPGAVRIFGVNIVPPGIPASTAEEASSDATETDPSSAATTDIDQ